MMEKIKIIIILAFIISVSEVSAAPPMYISDPDCFVSGVIKDIEYKEHKCGRHCQDCKDPTVHVTDCEFLPPAEEYIVTIKISDSVNKESAKDSVVCSNIYSPNKEQLFSISTNLFSQFQLKNGDVISGKVLKGGKFSSLQKNNNTDRQKNIIDTDSLPKEVKDGKEKENKEEEADEGGEEREEGDGGDEGESDKQQGEEKEGGINITDFETEKNKPEDNLFKRIWNWFLSLF